MNRNGYTIRLEAPADRRAVEQMVRDSFWNIYRPGDYEYYVLHVMRIHPDFVPEPDLVLEKDGVLIGQTVFVKSCIFTDDGRTLPTLTLGSICIAPSHERQGLGMLLLDAAFAKALGCEGCNLCPICTYPDAPCRHPDRAIPSVEACGIHVVEFSRNIGLKYNNGPNTVTYFCIVLLDPVN